MPKELIHGSLGEGTGAVITSCDAQPAGLLLDVPRTTLNSLPLPPEFAWFEGAVGPLISGSTILISGPPGSSKSTIGTELCLQLGAQNVRTLTILTEEAPQRLLARAVRLCSSWPQDTAKSAIGHMHCDPSLLDIYNLPPFLATHVLADGARHAGCKVIVLDSVQADGLPSSSHRTYARLFEFARTAKAAGITTILICHQTKRGQIAGPRGLEHFVDQVLLLRKALDARLLYVAKNRHGAENVRGVPLAIDPVTGGLQPSPYTEPTAGVARTFMCRAFGTADIQAMITLPARGGKSQVHAQGIGRKRVEQLLGCIGRVPGLDLADLDISLSAMLPSDAVFRAPQGLALCIAVVSTFLRRPVVSTDLFVGEIDLSRSIRAPRPAYMQELCAAIVTGEIDAPVRIICPPDAAVMIPDIPTAQVVPVETLDAAIRLIFTALH